MPLTSRLLLFFLCPACKKGGVGVPSGLLAGKARGPQAIGPRIGDARLVAACGFYLCMPTMGAVGYSCDGYTGALILMP